MRIPDADYVYEGLLRYNYLPMVKEQRDDIPPLFSTEDLTPSVGDMLVAHFDNLDNSERKRFNRDGFDQIEYRTTRFNNVLRLMHVPHPLPFARFCRCIRDEWKHLDYVCKNEHSQIKPERHADARVYVMDEYDGLDTGRVVVMEKERFPKDVKHHLVLSLGANYRVEADVSGCFPSIYSHAIPWALVGHRKSKKNRDSSKWYNRIDQLQRLMKRNETQGVPVGPATSNIVNEMVLTRVDEALSKKEYQFVRHIDDYKCYCTTRDQAEEFIRDLERELSLYLLSLNARKVDVAELPIPSKSSWVTQLSDHLPPTEKATKRMIVNALDAAVHLQAIYPQGSVIKYAARSLAGKLSKRVAPLYCQYVLQLAFYYPVVLPILCEAVKRYRVKLAAASIEKILCRQVTYRRSDMICWTVYLTKLVKGKVQREIADRLLEARDCMAMASLLAIGQHRRRVLKYVKTIDSTQSYELDKNWLLLHELIKRGEEFGPELKAYAETSGLTLLVDEGVSFLTM